MIKQLYSIIQLDEAIKTMEAGADNIGLVPMQMGGVPAHRVPLYRVDQIHEECRLRGVKMVLIMLTNDPDDRSGQAPTARDSARGRGWLHG